MKEHFLLGVVFTCLMFIGMISTADESIPKYQDARWNPIHFKPAIDSATDEQCLSCHQEILENKPLKVSPAGVKSSDTLAWYQTSDLYEGEQDTFHRRHIVSSTAKRLMNFKCNTCHQGNNPNTEVVAIKGSQHGNANLTKQVDTDICLMCHGRFDYKVMSGLSGDWPQVKETFKNDCITCHKEFRTRRHEVNFLNAKQIEIAGLENNDSCYGCHGGRSWYAIPYPYVRRPWLERMPGKPPEWAVGRAQEYPKRFLSKTEEPGLTAIPEWLRDSLKKDSSLFSVKPEKPTESEVSSEQ